ncbi:MAG: PhoPQ-activated pathogenicity-related family protein [Planctomycetaceae bacterium]|nr:PhoPQ-activated pathogenicity-related family protein [Planctomycetaceae bacterium]
MHKYARSCFSLQFAFISLVLTGGEATVSGQTTVTLESSKTAAVISAVTESLPTRTAIDDYVQKPDPVYRWKIVKSETVGDLQLVVIDMVSQSWRTPEEVNRTEWQHWITCAVPKNLRSETGFLMIGGGANGGSPPDGPSDVTQQIARATGSVVCELKMVPNQPLIFHNDGVPRTEDDLIGYTWDQYIKTGDSTWLARNAMIKSAVRAMDSITAMMASETGGGRTVNKFVVAGGSKRGWTTWLTGAMDPRVVAIVPIVIDVLNVDLSMRHHFAAYGFWAPSMGNYVQHRIMERLDNPRLKDAYKLVDPYYYRHRLTMPKFIVCGSGDQFFLPDSSQFYFDDLLGPKYLRYVPNADHGLKGTDAMESITAFYGLVLADREPPRFSWTHEKDGSIRVITEDKPQEVRLWQATNPDARDFRLETLGPKYVSSLVESADGKKWTAKADTPSKGWTASFMELTWDVGMPVPLKMTTSVRVDPDVLPYKDKPLDKPFSLTVVATAPSAEAAKQSVTEVEQLVASGTFPVNKFKTLTRENKCYFHWSPDHDGSRSEAAALTKKLEQLGLTGISYQLESGPEITP